MGDKVLFGFENKRVRSCYFAEKEFGNGTCGDIILCYPLQG
jgi:hypothetical protein